MQNGMNGSAKNERKAVDWIKLFVLKEKDVKRLVYMSCHDLWLKKVTDMTKESFSTINVKEDQII